ncbi:MAG: GNAT family N-acetyltransferase [Bacilli bacterium]|nr:GNAT family N-acetyltransferase [Bacilli bacterium]
MNSLFQKLLDYERENYDDNIKENLCINSFFDKRVNVDNNIILVALIDNKIVGYVYCIVDNDNKITKETEAKIESIYVDLEYRNKGIGTKLINEIISLLKEKNVKYIFIENLVENQNSKYLYEKLGFKIFREDRRKELV